jgi:signal transduction histidine kinase
MTQNNMVLEQITNLEAQICQLNQEKTELKALLEKATARAAKGNFLNLISHELRTPLTSVNGALELLKETEIGPLNNFQVEFLRVAVKNTTRTINLIETLFDIARFETGLLNLEKIPVNLKSTLENILAAGLKKTFEGKQIGLTLELTSDPFVEADPRRLYQILENLLSNACKFTPCGGEVAVQSIPQPDGKTLISVRDSGVGLSKQTQAYHFARDFQVEDFLSRELNHGGLGLTITNCLLALHQTNLRVESTPGQGSTFSFALPAPRATTSFPSILTL